ncbi:MAG: flagellin [Terracidiphilus sp.]|nr:flagellin [Terracidiphilus sp.]
MSIGVLFNIAANAAAHNLDTLSVRMSRTLQQLSSGSRINSAADDPAAISIIDGMNANIAALSQSVINNQESIGMLSVADGALSQVTNMLERAVTLATEASNGTLNSTQSDTANQEFQSILAEITNIGSTTTYNGKQVFGSVLDSFTSDSSSVGSFLNQLTFSSLSSSSLGSSDGTISIAAASGSTPATISYSGGSSTSLSGIDLRTTAGAQKALTAIHQAISAVSAQDGYIGSQINILDAQGSMLQTQEQNTLSSLNAIESTDYATATSDLANEQVQMQMAIAALSQAIGINKDEVTKLVQSF